MQKEFRRIIVDELLETGVFDTTKVEGRALLNQAVDNILQGIQKYLNMELDPS